MILELIAVTGAVSGVAAVVPAVGRRRRSHRPPTVAVETVPETFMKCHRSAKEIADTWESLGETEMATLHANQAAAYECWAEIYDAFIDRHIGEKVDADIHHITYPDGREYRCVDGEVVELVNVAADEEPPELSHRSREVMEEGRRFAHGVSNGLMTLNEFRGDGLIDASGFGTRMANYRPGDLNPGKAEWYKALALECDDPYLREGYLQKAAYLEDLMIEDSVCRKVFS